jgi:hypothetical protein
MVISGICLRRAVPDAAHLEEMPQRCDRLILRGRRPLQRADVITGQPRRAPVQFHASLFAPGEEPIDDAPVSALRARIVDRGQEELLVCEARIASGPRDHRPEIIRLPPLTRTRVPSGKRLPALGRLIDDNMRYRLSKDMGEQRPIMPESDNAPFLTHSTQTEIYLELLG